MKKYRCLWYVSTTNHNILYLVHIQGISLLNSGTCLWKAQNSLARRELGAPVLPRFLCTPAFGSTLGLLYKPGPHHERMQGPNLVHHARSPVQIVRIPDRSTRKCPAAGKARGARRQED